MVEYRVQLEIGVTVTIEVPDTLDSQERAEQAAYDGVLVNHEVGTISDLWLIDAKGGPR